MIETKTLSCQEAAEALVGARKAGRALAAFPGEVPDTLEGAYALQAAAIALMGEEIAGWKVGRLSPDLAERFGVDRFLGPVFRADVIAALGDGPTPFAMFTCGSAAFEAEFMVFVGIDAQGAVYPKALTTGIEIASSPVACLPELGSLATVADLGNNAGQIIGAPIPVELLDQSTALTCRTFIGSADVVARDASALPGGPATAFAFAVETARALGFPLREGQFVSTGAVTGMHAVEPGLACRTDFGAFGTIACDIVTRPVQD